MMEVSDDAVAVHVAVPTFTVLSPGVTLNPVPAMVSVPAMSRVDGVTLVIVGVAAS